MSVDAGDAVPQPPPCAALSCHAGSRHQGITVKAPGKMSRHVGSDLILPLFPWCIGWAMPTNRIRAVLAGMNRPFGTHVQSIELASQHWSVPRNGGVLFHSVAGCSGYP